MAPPPLRRCRRVLALPDHIWEVIASKLTTPIERIRFGAVCKAWGSFIATRPAPCLLISSDTPRSGFLRTADNHVVELDLPEAQGAVFMGSTGAWVVTQHDKDGTMMRILNPFSRAQVNLPQFVESVADIHKVILSSAPFVGDCIALGIFRSVTLAFARPGDTCWTVFDAELDSCITDVIFLQGQFHGITEKGTVFACGIGDGRDSPPKVSIIMHGFHSRMIRYLVEFRGGVLQVVRPSDQKFKVYRMDLVKKRRYRLGNLGEYSLFLGRNTTVAVPASDYLGLVKSNRIYFELDHDFSDKFCSAVFYMDGEFVRKHRRGNCSYNGGENIWIVPPRRDSSAGSTG